MKPKIKITMLGTSGQIPTAKRNHTGLLLNYGKENILFDCGEGIQRQFRKAKLNPCKVNRILITHIHGDHVFGLPGLLSTFNFSEYNKTLFIYGPKGIRRFLEEFIGVLTIKRKFKIVVKEVSGKFFEAPDFYLEAEKMEHGIPTNAYNFVKKGQIRIDKSKLKKLKIPAGPHLQKLKQGKNMRYKNKKYLAKNLTFRENDLKMSFVMDTLVNKKMVGFVKGADLFVCESSFGEELEAHAKKHMHMTSKQAAQVAKKAKVKKLILTHISQRYEKNLKIILNPAKKIFKNTSLVEDFDVLEI